MSESTALSAASSADTRSSKLETTISAVFDEEGELKGLSAGA